MYIKYRNNEFLLTHFEEVPKKNFRYVKIVWKEQDIPAEYVDLLITPLSKLDINFRVLRALRKYNIYQLEDLLRFIKYNGFDALYQMPSVGTFFNTIFRKPGNSYLSKRSPTDLIQKYFS